MATPGSAQRLPKRWVEDHEVLQCPLCATRFDSSIFDLTTSRRTHCRYCGGVFCTNCCREELYMPEDEVRPPLLEMPIVVPANQRSRKSRMGFFNCECLSDMHLKLLSCLSSYLKYQQVLFLSTSMSSSPTPIVGIFTSSGRSTSRLFSRIDGAYGEDVFLPVLF